MNTTRDLYLLLKEASEELGENTAKTLSIYLLTYVYQQPIYQESEKSCKRRLNECIKSHFHRTGGNTYHSIMYYFNHKNREELTDAPKDFAEPEYQLLLKEIDSTIRKYGIAPARNLIITMMNVEGDYIEQELYRKIRRCNNKERMINYLYIHIK